MATDSWISYFTLVGGEVYRISVDAGIGERAPIAKLPVLTRLTVRVKGSKDYFFTPEEGDALDRAAHALHAIVSKPGPGSSELAFVGRKAHVGECLLYFHGERPVDEPELVELARRLPGVEWSAASADDPGWKLYLSDLHPGAALNPLLLTWAQLEQRRRDGDDLNVARAVDHTLLFADREERRRFLDQFSHGEELEATLVDADDGERPFGLTLTLRDRLALPAIEPMVVGLARSAVRFGGLYDGWGALAVLEEEPA